MPGAGAVHHIRLYGGGFKTEFAAKLAGEKALSEFLGGLAEQ